uniref:cysteine dioxygenase n=1 Tax=Oryza sativa subsp. japonica TaxID=39947 RepID=Q8H317_ORYSJ|nr:HGWP repeat containing protein-like [Oryza sativa Japonica Group]BAC99793.1 HGWP repeat containing protein-like [Oryza sativa Japonica Group]
MPPLLGVYDFTAGLPPSPPIGASAYTAGLLCRRCWASTTSPPACLRRRRVVPPPTRLAYYAAAVGRLRLHRRPASVAAEWCLRLHGWPIMPPLLGVYDFTAGLPPSPPSGASAYTTGLLCRCCWASTTSPPACLRRRRLVPPPTRLAYYAAAVGRLRLHRRPVSVAADWCPRLYGWLVTPPFMGVHVFTTGLPPSPPIGVSAYTAGLLCRRCWASTTSPPACLRRRRVVPPPTRLAYYAAAVGRLRLHRRPASVAAEWCLRLHGWPIMPLLLGVYDFTAGLPPSPPSGASAYTAGLLCRRCWASTTSPPACLRRRRVVPPPTRLAYYAAAVGRLRLHRRPASVAADWCLRLHGWPIMPPLLGVYDFTAGLSPSPPTGVLAYTVGWSHHRSWASTSSPPACLRRRRLVSPPTRLAYYAAAVGRLRLHRRLASVAAEWCLRLHGWPIMPPLLGVYDFTAGLPPSPPSGASAYTAGLLCRCCWASTTSPPACLRRRRLVPPPTRLAYYAAAVGRLRLHRRPASVAADWCPRLYGWLVTPPFMGVHVFTTGLPPSPPSGASAYTAGLLCRCCWASTSSPPACLRRRRLVPPSTRLAYYAAAVGRLRLHRRPASVAADWCLRLHGWPIMPPLLGVYDFTAGLPPSPPTGVLAYTVGWSHHRSWASTSSPPACLRRRRVVPPPTRLAYYAAAVGRLRLHRRPASVAADWCLRLHGWPIMPPLLGVYDFTAGLPPSPPSGASAYTAGLLCRRCWASTTSPPACLRRRRAVPPPTRLAYYAAAVGRLRLHRRPASVAADWCLRLYGWLVTPPLLGVYVFTTGLPPSPPTGASAYTDPDPDMHKRDSWLSAYLLRSRNGSVRTSPTGLPSPPPTGVSACTAGLYAAVVGRLRLHRPACLRRCRLVFPPAQLAFMPPLLGVYVFTDRLAFAAADWCFRLHGWPLCRHCWASTSSPTGLPSPPPTGVSACTAGLYAAVVGRLRLHRPACLRRRRLVFPPARLAFMPPLLGVYVFTDRLAFVAADRCPRLHGWPLCRRCWASTSSPTGLPSPPPTGVSACTAGLYAAVVGRLRLHRPAAASAADWCHRLHGWPVITPTDAIFFTAGYIAVTTNRHQYLQHNLPTFAMAADWFLHFHGCMILPVLIGLTIFIAGRLVCC